VLEVVPGHLLTHKCGLLQVFWRLTFLQSEDYRGGLGLLELHLAVVRELDRDLPHALTQLGGGSLSALVAPGIDGVGHAIVLVVCPLESAHAVAGHA